VKYNLQSVIQGGGHAVIDDSQILLSNICADDIQIYLTTYFKL